MPINFKSIGKKTALRDILKIDSKLPITPFKNRSPFLLAPFLTGGGSKSSRKLKVQFNMYEWLNDAIARYEPFMSSFYSAWKASVFPGNIAAVNSSLTTRELQEHLAQFGTYARSMINSTSFMPARLHAAPIGLKECTFSAVHNENITCSFFCVGPGPRRTNYRYSGGRSAHTIVSNLDALSQGTLFYLVVHDDNSHMTRWFTIKPSAVLFDQTAVDAVFANPTTDSVVNFVAYSACFIEASMPKGYDDAYNKQSLLPFVDAKGSFFNESNTVFNRRTSYRWRVNGEGHSIGPGSTRDCSFTTDWSGACYEAPFPKRDLTEYELTRDPAFVGKGKIYVADDDVCCCPHTGYALQCTIDDQYVSS
jgi:hypothetical protein